MTGWSTEGLKRQTGREMEVIVEKEEDRQKCRKAKRETGTKHL